MITVAGTGTRRLQTESVEVKKEVLELTKTALQELNAEIVISGGAEGFDTCLMAAAIQLELPFHIYLPNPSYVNYYWGSKSQEGRNRAHEFEYYRERATNVVIICPTVFENGRHSNFIRNDVMIDHADMLLAYRPFPSSGTDHAINYARKNNVAVSFII